MTCATGVGRRHPAAPGRRFGTRPPDPSSTRPTPSRPSPELAPGPRGTTVAGRGRTVTGPSCSSHRFHRDSPSDRVRVQGFQALSDATVARVANQKGVGQAVGGLRLQVLKINGRFQRGQWQQGGGYGGREGTPGEDASAA